MSFSMHLIQVLKVEKRHYMLIEICVQLVVEMTLFKE